MKRLWSLFEKRGFRYHRVTQLAFSKPVAVRAFQDRLLGATNLSLRPVFDTWDDNVRNYKPPVEVLDAEFQHRIHRSSDGEKRLRDAIENAVARKLSLPQALGYKTAAKP